MAGNSDETAKPRGKGKPFVKGASGNPNGRPKVAAEFKERCRSFVDSHVIDAWQNEVLNLGENWTKAAELLAAYGYGKPTQSLEHTGADGEALSIQIIRKVAK